MASKNADAYIGRCLESLNARSTIRATATRLIVADAMSTDETARSPGATTPSSSTTTARDLPTGGCSGFQHSKGELIAFCDSDCVMDPAWLRNAVKYFDDAKVGGASGPTLVPPDETAFGRGAGFVYSLAVAADASAHADKKLPRSRSSRISPAPTASTGARRSARRCRWRPKSRSSEDVLANWHVRT